MLDISARKLVDPILDKIAVVCIRLKITANAVTLIGFGFGVLACVAVSQGMLIPALVLMSVNRILDGLDGMIARRTVSGQLGGFLDIVCDFLFYSGYVFAFAVYRPEFALWAALLIYSFVATGATFLTYALFLEKNKHSITADPHKKSFFYIGGLAEGTETIAVFAAFTIFADYFPQISAIFAGICWVTALTRIYEGYKLLKNR
ncbi:hypothetical protein CHS0354_002020 [Potamilus streckersoni]|uniref:CDP-alcohol phosphatidyltransferase family protein n=1 Tax=Potamilus streckersoni TaxID=2493646 RepID=A0AAE0T5I7_9BIVA|nr:hypothetical protein CHS0354_002020 [Potamilus streckersoni]